MADLWALYRFDAWSAHGGSSRDVALAFGLIDRLRFEPMSMYRAEMAGNEDFMGWTRDSSILAAIYNATAAGNKGKKLTAKETYPVPEVKKQKKEMPVPRSVKEIDWGSTLGGLRG